MAPEDNHPVSREELRVELGALEDRLTGQMVALEDRMVEKMRNIETTLLTDFRKWALPVNFRLTSLETHTERLALIEERLTNLERR